MTNQLFPLTLEDFTKYKYCNKNPNEDVLSFASSISSKIKNKNKLLNWRRNDKPPNNWILNKKFTQDEDEKLISQFRSILNKLSESNFDELAKELINQEIKKQSHLITLVEFIFSKAISETNFCDTYAKLSKELSLYYIEEEEKRIFFREILINKCQIMFMETISIDTDSPGGSLKNREQILGCISFIGHLYNNDLLTKKIIYNCFQLLFLKVNLNKAYIIDSLCLLLNTVGLNFSKKCPEETEICFFKLDKLKDSPEISKKDKFSIMDILDKRNKWCN